MGISVGKRNSEVKSCSVYTEDAASAVEQGVARVRNLFAPRRAVSR